MNYEEYLDFERRAGTKHEYVNGFVYAMSGCTPEHGRLAMRFGYLLGAAIGDRPCEIFSSDVRVRVESTGRSTYPDLSVVCGPIRPASDDKDALTNPVVVVEILSDSTEASDRGEKWAHYQRLDSLKEYVLVSQTDRRVEVYRRGDVSWTYEAHVEGDVSLASLGLRVSLDELYHDPTATEAMPSGE